MLNHSLRGNNNIYNGDVATYRIFYPQGEKYYNYTAYNLNGGDKMIGDDFSYDGKQLSAYNMIMCDPESDQEFVSRAIDRSEITSVRSTPNHFSVHYEDTKTLEFLIIKDPCEYPDQKDAELTGDDISALREWLESPKKPTELVVDDGDNTNDTVHYFGLFTSVQPFVIGMICYGLKLTFICDSPYGFSDEVTTTITVNASSDVKTGTFNNKSAEKKGYLRPVITINSSSTFGSSETIKITNTSDSSRYFQINLPSGASKLVIDCDKKTILDNAGNLISLADLGVGVPSSGDYSFINADIYLFYWLRLIPGVNSLTVKGSSTNTISTVVISAKYPIKSGGF